MKFVVKKGENRLAKIALAANLEKLSWKGFMAYEESNQVNDFFSLAGVWTRVFHSKKQMAYHWTTALLSPGIIFVKVVWNSPDLKSGILLFYWLFIMNTSTKRENCDRRAWWISALVCCIFWPAFGCCTLLSYGNPVTCIDRVPFFQL